MAGSDGTMQAATADGSNRLPTNLDAFRRQVRQIRHTLTLKGFGFLFKWEFDEFTNKPADDGRHGRCNDTRE